MSIDNLADDEVRTILERTKVIALVGASNKPDRPANYVGAFLQRHGYRVIPVNPAFAGQEINGETVYASLGDVPEKIDLIDVFRAAEHVPALVDEALALPEKPAVVWMQMGIVNEPAAEKARAGGIQVVMDRCPKVEIPRLRPAPPVS